jgi:AraC-like DNA-binding protein
VRYYPDEKNPWEYTWIEFSGEGFLLLLDEIMFCDGNCVIDYIKPELILPLYDYLCSIWYSTSRTLFNYTFNNVVLAILSVYSEQFPINGQRMCESIYFDSARAIIRSSYHNAEFGIKSICKELNISRVTLHRSFIKSCGVSPGVYLAEYRIERAKELLKRGVAVKETALSCGFADPLYFSKAFCKSEGISPREFRRLFEIK